MAGSASSHHHEEAQPAADVDRHLQAAAVKPVPQVSPRNAGAAVSPALPALLHPPRYKSWAVDKAHEQCPVFAAHRV
eukprot:Skav213530  [mRNA]  locus=scaffold1184:51675:51905:+ [translate_table: standard]